MEKELLKVFSGRFGVAPKALSRAPGRLEVLGNHTDYNEGFVLGAATSQATLIAMSPSDGGSCTLHNPAMGGDFTLSLDEIDSPVTGEWLNYVKGVLVQLRKRGIPLHPFNAAVASSVPLSAGMSSSASLEMSLCYALKTAFGFELPPDECARLGQSVENDYLGLKSGLLDQFCSIYGRRDSLILCDFRTAEVVKSVRMPSAWRLVVANTLVKHNLVESDYNRRRESCERARDAIAASGNPEVKALRDVNSSLLSKSRKSMDVMDYRRALHVVGENERVQKGVFLLEGGDIEDFGRLLHQSHESSRNNFENSCEELDCLVELSRSIPGCAGARLSGGGFGGISIHLVREQDADGYCARLKTAYNLQTGKTAETIICSLGDGASAKTIN